MAGRASPGPVLVDRGRHRWPIAVQSSGDPRLDYEVRKSDRDGLRLLDAGHDIQGHSLTRSGDTVYWMKAGTIRSAAID